ncbi:MAG: amidophosphoribosyltransferase [Parcubacteria group bacterium]|nr:amidophosphoribosyltransferase [Parcubacteria group bacterium]
MSFKIHKGMGRLRHVFPQPKSLQEHCGSGVLAIGHVRYSTRGSSTLQNAQPFLIDDGQTPFVLAHNGQIVDTDILTPRIREAIDRINQRRRAAGFVTDYAITSTSDSELIAAMLVGNSEDSWEKRFQNVLSQLTGAYSFICGTPHTLFAIRDPLGIRPLTVGKIPNGHVIASETAALDAIGATWVREIAAGEGIVLTSRGPRAILQHLLPPQIDVEATCVFEYVYLMFVTGTFRKRNVHAVRVRAGMLLAQEHSADADVVVGVPDSGLSAAQGYAAASGIPLDLGIIVRSKDVSERTFIEPEQSSRDSDVLQKLRMNHDAILGKRIVIVEDSIVRGTNAVKVVSRLKQLGALEVHVRVASPPICHPCYYGIDIKDWSELAWNKFGMSVDGVRKAIGADSLGYLSPAGLLKAVGFARNQVCMACMDGDYPTSLPEQLKRRAFGDEQ